MSDDIVGNKAPDEKRRCSAKEHSENLKSLIEKATEGGKKHIKVALFTHNCPDPDALGSMMGMAHLLYKTWGIESDLFYAGEISHPQNNAINNLLDPQLKRAKEEYKAELYALNILCDTIPSNAGVADHKIEFDVVIDHHKELPNGGFTGLIIHMKTGSCCAIVYKLMECLCKPAVFDDDNDNDSKVATAMIAGIVTDTEYMVSDDSTELEFDAFSKMFPFRHSNFLKQIVFFKKPKFWIDVKATAATEAVVDDEGYAIVGLGLIPEKQRDLIADMAEEMVTWASVETAIAFAVVGGERIEGSVRSLNASISVSEFCKKLGSRHGVGGGKMGKGAYRYSLAGMSIDPDEDEETKRKTWDLIKEKETKRISRMIKK
jgi:nanoRNase/pAp phosphatase (c-di-AMP/oligoRNAs hydrolase)